MRGSPKRTWLDVLSSLVSKSLVVAETTSRAQARYRLLETIREYALEKLGAAGEAARLRDRHLDVFLGSRRRGRATITRRLPAALAQLVGR